MSGKSSMVTSEKLSSHAAGLKKEIRDVLNKELADCALPDLASDAQSGALWASLPTVDSKTAFKISASVIERVLGCEFRPIWIRRGGYISVDEAVAHVMDQLKVHCVAPTAVHA
jgi:hypothetical protein